MKRFAAITAMTRTRPVYIKLLLCGVTAVVLVRLLNLHVDGVNGPSYFRWIWQQLAWERVALGFAVAAVPFFVGQYLYGVRRWSTKSALRAVALSLLLLQLIGVGLRRQPFSLTMATKLVQSGGVTSYYTDAVQLEGKKDQSLSQWLRDFPKILPKLNLHSTTKPPGPVLFYVPLVRLFGAGDGAATIGALLVALLTSLGVFAVHRFIQVMTEDDQRGFHGASLYALLPGIVVIHPMFDQILPILTCGMIGLWAAALQARSLPLAFASGLFLAAACFFSYSLMTLGVFLIAYSVVAWFRGNEGRTRVMLLQVAAAAVGFLLFYATLWLAVRYDPIASFASARLAEKGFQSWLRRPYPTSIYWDLEDFGLGVGWIAVLLMLFGLLRSQPWSERVISLLGVSQIVLIAVTGLLAGETARVFLFMVPLLLTPIDGELSRWKPLERMAAYACLLAVTAAACRNLIFLNL